ncbi:MAG: leucyl/phenylalanyl-tRNA--protein transferase [Alphaproteobacteria bacterium]|nr:leucyl/phenylalanyl-tRNA--protein transferase [Alphaproteobacteria bacterium]
MSNDSAQRNCESLTVETLLFAYSQGFFPMSKTRNSSEIFMVDPLQRGILPLDGFHIPRRLQQRMRNQPYELRINTDFAAVLAQCAAAAPDRHETWINHEIAELYLQLHRTGYAHSVESWQDGRLVGGLYGVSYRAAFFGESMFSRATDASKVALVHLVRILRQAGFVLLDTQFLNAHLAQFGVIEIPRDDYRQRLQQAMAGQAQFPSSRSDS